MKIKRTLAIPLLAALLLGGGAFVSTLSAQEPQRLDLARQQFIFGVAQVDLPSTDANLRAGRIVLSRGQATLPIQTNGAVVVLGLTGEALLYTDKPAMGVRPESDGTGGPVRPAPVVDTDAVTAGFDGTGGPAPLSAGFPTTETPFVYSIIRANGVSLENDSRLQIRGNSEDQAVVLIISLDPAEAGTP